MLPAAFNALKRDREAAHLVGMPWEHAQIFMQIAKQERCIISSRQLGRVCMGLMSGGYDTKGFRMKSKSCDFGPMAGFICVDERLHKKGAGYNKKQKEDVDHALHGDKWDRTGRWRASTEQICLTQARFDELRAWADAENTGARIDAIEVVPGTWIGTVLTPVRFDYVLRKEERFGDTVYALYYTNETLSRQTVSWKFGNWSTLLQGNELKPLLSLVNPYPPYPNGHYKNCCTGDYDLFGVWPIKKLVGIDAFPQHLRARLGPLYAGNPIAYDPLGEDRRIAGMSRTAATMNKQTTDFEDLRLGNISNRVHTIGQLINSLVQSQLNKGGRYCRDVIHHSDEAGRPFISGIDDHIIAFIPGADRDHIVGVESPNSVPNAMQWTAFLTACDMLGFKVIANAHWIAQLTAWGVMDRCTLGDEHGWRTPHTSPVRST